MKSVLVLCEGNICRSPMAEGLLAAGLRRMEVRSAGLGALVGNPADPTAVSLMRERGLDISGHRAVQVNRALCVESDIILVMDDEQLLRVQKMYPEVHGRVFRIGHYANVDVPDPYRQPAEAFRTALTLLDESIEHWKQRIQRL